MGNAIEMLAFRVANPGTTFSAVTMATGNSNVVRQFTPSAGARLEHVTRQGATAGGWRILSPVLHDNVTGITLLTSLANSVMFLPDYIGEPMQPGDTLTIQGTGGTAETEVGTITINYNDVLGLNAMLYMWEDILPNIEHVKTFEVDCTVGGTAGIWADTLFNATDKQAKADRKYALLGYTTDTALAAVAVYGGETGNVRIGGPGSVNTEDTAFWFIQESIRSRDGHIPVISANNFGSTNVSIVTTATSGTAKIVLNCALLRAGF